MLIHSNTLLSLETSVVDMLDLSAGIARPTCGFTVAAMFEGVLCFSAVNLFFHITPCDETLKLLHVTRVDLNSHLFHQL